MRVRVNGRAFRSHPGLRVYVEQRLLSTLGHLTRHVDRVAVTAEPIDRGLLKGAHSCQIWAGLRHGRQLRLLETAADLFAAIDAAAEMLARDVEYVESRLPPGPGLRCA